MRKAQNSLGWWVIVFGFICFYVHKLLTGKVKQHKVTTSIGDLLWGQISPTLIPEHKFKHAIRHIHDVLNQHLPQHFMYI